MILESGLKYVSKCNLKLKLIESKLRSWLEQKYKINKQIPGMK